MLVAVTDINIEATTGADLNHFVRKILKSDFIIFIRLLMNQFEMHQLVEVMLEDSKGPKLLRQWTYSLQESYLVGGERVL